MNMLQHFMYNLNGMKSDSYQYGSDIFGNVTSVDTISSYDLTDENKMKMGYIQFSITGSATTNTTDFYDETQLYNEFGSVYVTDVGSFTYNISFKSGSSVFDSGLVVPTIISATGMYYDNVDKIAIIAKADGTRDVWVSLKMMM